MKQIIEKYLLEKHGMDAESAGQISSDIAHFITQDPRGVLSLAIEAYRNISDHNYGMAATTVREICSKLHAYGD